MIHVVCLLLFFLIFCIMNWELLKKKVESTAAEISTIERENKNLNNRISELKEKKKILERTLERLDSDMKDLRLSLMKINKEYKDVCSKLRLLKTNYILNNGNLDGYIEDESEAKELFKSVEKERDLFKEAIAAQTRLNEEIKATNGNIANVELRIRENKEKIAALNQSIAGDCSEDIVEEIVETDDNVYSITINHRIYNPRTISVIDNRRYYIKNRSGWYLDRSSKFKVNKKINDESRIAKLNGLLSENLKI